MPVSDVSDVGIVTSNGCIHGWILPSVWRFPPRLAVQVILSRAIWHHFYATGSACFVKNAIAGRLASEVPGYLFQEGVELASRVRLSGSSEVSPQVAARLTKWCKRFLDWESNHQPDDVPGTRPSQ